MNFSRIIKLLPIPIVISLFLNLNLELKGYEIMTLSFVILFITLLFWFRAKMNIQSYNYEIYRYLSMFFLVFLISTIILRAHPISNVTYETEKLSLNAVIEERKTYNNSYGYVGNTEKGKIYFNSMAFYDVDSTVNVSGETMIPEIVKANKDVNREIDLALVYANQNIKYVFQYPEVKIVKETSSLDIKNETIMSISPENRGVFAGVVMGDSRYLSLETKKLYQNTQLSHVLVFSGANVALIMLLISYLAFSGSKRNKFILEIIAIILVALLVKLDPPVLRALFIALLYAMSKYWNKVIDFEYLICLSFVVVFVISPNTLISNVSFILTYLATYIIIRAGRIVEWLFWNRGNRIQALVVAITVSLLMLPVSIYYFGYYNFLASIISPLLLPLIAIINITGILYALIYIISFKTMDFMSFVVELPIVATNFLVNMLSHSTNVIHETLASASVIMFYVIAYILFNILEKIALKYYEISK